MTVTLSPSWAPHPREGPPSTGPTLTNRTSSGTPSQMPLGPEGCLVLTKASGGFIPWDNPHNIISQDVEKLVDAVVGGVCLPVLFLIAVPCNVLNMLVFWRQGFQERINLCLFYLSLVDLLHMLNNFFFNADRLHHSFMNTAAFGPVLRFIVDHHLVGFRGLTALSGFISVLIACERCLCVVSPLRSQRILRRETTAAILAAGTAVIMTMYMVLGLRWDLICVFDSATNTTSEALYTSRFYSQNKAHMNLLSLFVGTVQSSAYITIVVATTTVTSVKLKKMLAWRQEQSSSKMSLREMALTRTLVAISILYVVCAAPIMIIGLGIILVPGISLSGRYYNLSNLLVSLFKLTSFINATFNFFVFYFLGSKFKETLRTLLRCRDQ